MEGSRKRIADLDKLFSRIYEDNVIGKLSDERYARMAAEHESEQKELLEKVRRKKSSYLKWSRNRWICACFYRGCGSLPI